MKMIPAIFIIVFINLSISHAQNPSSIQLKSFEEVWRTIDTRHFDPSTNGLDWQAMYKRYRPQIIEVQDNREFSAVANRMLFELKQSHVLVASEKVLELYMGVLFSPGTVGLDVRWLDGKAIVTKVRPGFSADNSGIRPGYELVEIGGEAIDSIVKAFEPLPPFNDRNLTGGIANYLIGHLNGQPGSSILLVYRDHESREKKVRLARQSRGPGKILNPAMPLVYLEFEEKWLEEGITYVRFNHFAEPIEQDFLDTLENPDSTKGLIIDLRGNPGGYFSTLDVLAGKLLGSGTHLYDFHLRNKTVKRFIEPADNPYKGPVVVIIDETSMSASELFASCLQAVGRAVIIGNRSPGYLLGANWQRLSNDLSFMYPILHPVPVGGQVVENHGVSPDIPVALSRKSLLDGGDAQLQAAIDYILKGR